MRSFAALRGSAADLLPGPPLVPSSVLTPAESGSRLHGLHAEYWTNTHFEGEPSLVRTDGQVGLNLGFFNFVASVPVAIAVVVVPGRTRVRPNVVAVETQHAATVSHVGDAISSLAPADSAISTWRL